MLPSLVNNETKEKCFSLFATFSLTCPLFTCDPRSHDPFSLVAFPLVCPLCCHMSRPKSPNCTTDQSNLTNCQFPDLPITEDVRKACYGRLNTHPQRLLRERSMVHLICSPPSSSNKMAHCNKQMGGGVAVAAGMKK